MSTHHRFTLPASVGGSITLRELTVEEVFAIDSRVYAAVKTDADLVVAGATSTRERQIASIVMRNDKPVSGAEREDVYHKLGIKGVALLRAAYQSIHDVPEDEMADFLATRADA